MVNNFCKIKIKYEKGQEIRFISHLDHMRVLERAIRRAGLPIGYSQGFNPRMLISYKTKALKVGEASSECEAELTFADWVKPEEVKDALNLTLPVGFRIIEASFI
ncbi:MAG: TIGR03936 family radical SAM-associated protein [Candidatus Margulisiibacteriota bacterium]